MKFPTSLLIIILFFIASSACENDYGSGTKKPMKHDHAYEGDHQHGADHAHHDHASDNHSNDTPSIYDKIAEEYENAERGNWQKPRMVIERYLGDLTDKTVADIGAGPIGYFSFRIVQRAEKTIAIDIDQTAIDKMNEIRSKLRKDLQDRIEVRLVKPDNPKLREKEADVVLIVNTITYIDDRVAYLKNLRTGLADGGKIVIIDYKKRRLPIGPPPDEKLPLYQVELDLEKAGYSQIYADDRSLDYQYAVTAVK